MRKQLNNKKNKKIKVKFKDRDVFNKIRIYRRVAFIVGLIGVLCLLGFLGNLDKVEVWVILAGTLPEFIISLSLFVWAKYLFKKHTVLKPEMV